MIPVGIEAMNIFGGTAYINVSDLASFRRLDTTRFENLLMKEKAVIMLHEDPVTCGVNAAKPIMDQLTQEEKNRIELLITCTESGIDFGKSISTYIHHYLQLNRKCRLFEIKQACYSGTAGLQMAIGFILSGVSPGAKALVIASDIYRHIEVEGGEGLTDDWSFMEPSTGMGAVALLVSHQPHVFQMDVGANGYYGYEVMDTCRPFPETEAGNADLSLMSYLDCCEMAYLEYEKKVEGADYRKSFQYLAFHTPFGGMVKGAHRNMMRKICQSEPDEIEDDFEKRVVPGMDYCQRVGSVMGGSLFLSLASTIANGQFDAPKRIGCFSYGSGCCSEFYSGVVRPEGRERILKYKIKDHLDQRYSLTMDEYDILLKNYQSVKFGTRNAKIDLQLIPGVWGANQSKPRLFLREIKEFHREYDWSE